MLRTYWEIDGTKYMTECGIWYKQIFVPYGNITLTHWEITESPIK